jgi:20S proteasome alpha/beta subunit
VRQLDKYGHSVQLRHAAEASKRHGRLVVAVSWDCGGSRSDDNNSNEDDNDTGSVVTVLCTPLPSDLLSTNERQQQGQGQRQQRHVLRFTGRGVQRIRLPHGAASTGKLQQLGSGSAKDAIILGLQPLACVLNTRRRGPAVVTAVACSGLASDAAYVQNQLWEAAKVAWDKYDAEMGCPAVLAELQHLCRAFWRHPTKAQWTWKPPQPSGSDDEDEENQSAMWARPLGVTTLVVQLVNAGVAGKDSATQLYVVEPSGIVQHATCVSVGGDGADNGGDSRFAAKVACIGRDGPAVQARLEKALKERMVKEFGRSDDDESASSSTRPQRLTQDEMFGLIGDAMHDRQPGWRSPSSSDNGPQPTETNPSSLMYVEILTSQGAVERKVVVAPTAA